MGADAAKPLSPFLPRYANGGENNGNGGAAM
jgi:hypothetical protein